MNQLLKRFESASKDAVAAILSPEDMPDEVQRNKLNAKSLFRAGRAQYAASEFLTAMSTLVDALKLAPEDADILHCFSGTQDRIREMEATTFDTTILLKSLSSKNRRLDHASYLSGVVVRQAGARGRGLFATRKFAPGELVFAEKALEVAFAADRTTETMLIVNANTNRGQMGPQASLLWTVIDRLCHNPEQARAFCQLYSGNYTPACKVETIDDVTVIDCFQAQAILEHNVFGCPNLRSGDKSCRQDTSASSAGIWSTASYVNHACASNAHRTFYGDFMLVHASRAIAVGEEITMPYRPCVEDYLDAMKKIEETWHFRCDCEMWRIEQNINATARSARTRLLARVGSFMMNNKQSRHNRATKSIRCRIEQIYRDLVATYPADLYQGRPRVELVMPSMWLCQAACETMDEGMRSALEVLRNLGFRLVVQRDVVTIDREYALVHECAVDAAINVAYAKEMGRMNLSAKFMDFAKAIHRIINGDLHGFSECYGG